MLRALVIYDKECEGCIVGYELSGHANYAPTGKDIVCAGVSTINHMTQLYLDRLGIEYNIVVNNGYSKVILKNDKFLFTAQTPFKVLISAINDLKEQYPEHVTIVST